MPENRNRNRHQAVGDHPLEQQGDGPARRIAVFDMRGTLVDLHAPHNPVDRMVLLVSALRRRRWELHMITRDSPATAQQMMQPFGNLIPRKNWHPRAQPQDRVILLQWLQAPGVNRHFYVDDDEWNLREAHADAVVRNTFQMVGFGGGGAPPTLQHLHPGILYAANADDLAGIFGVHIP